MKDQFQIHSMSEGTLVQAQLLFLSSCRHKQSSGDSGCTLRTIVLFQLSPMKKHPMPSNPFELAVASIFTSSAMIGEIKSFEQSLKLQFSQLLMIFSS